MSVDSSVLGINCESYEHRYLDMRFEEHDPALMQINVGMFTGDVHSISDVTYVALIST